MSRLSAADRRALRDVRAALASWSGPGAGALAQLIRPIGEAIGVDRPFTYRVQVEGGRLRCAFAHGDLPASVAGEIEREMSRRPLNWTGYNPFCPEPHQRNRTLSVGPERVRRLGMYPTMRRYGLDGLHQMRALVCDGPTLLAWVGGFLDRRPTARQHALLDALVPALGRRLELDRRVETADLLSAALDHVLDQLGAAAFLVGPRGRVEHANAAGWARLAREGSSLLARIREATRRRDPELDAHPLALPGHSGHIVTEQPGDPAGERARRAAARWRLTRRQTQVLELLAQGHSNARIAAELRIAPGTVELHVAAIRGRAGVATRAALVAAVWAQPA